MSNREHCGRNTDGGGLEGELEDGEDGAFVIAKEGAFRQDAPPSSSSSFSPVLIFKPAGTILPFLSFINV